MQTLWEGKCEWDQPLPADIQAKWYDLTRDLQQAVLIEIPMYYFKEESITTGAKLHVFTDASQSAYGSCAYIVAGNQSILVMAKNRVAPLKQITLPKLELMGAVVGARLARHLLGNLGDMEIHFWSDSQIVLNWIMCIKPLKTFIANRVKEIKNLVKNQQWKHCPTDMNPADMLTRGLTSEKSKDINDLWMN